LIDSLSVISACRCAASSDKNIVNWKLQASPPWISKHSVIIASEPVLPTWVISSSPPTKTVSFPIFASKCPCFAIRSSKSSGEEPAISIPIRLSPEDVFTLKNLTSERPYTLSRCSETAIRSSSCASSSGTSALINARAPPRRSSPVFIFVEDIFSSAIDSIVVLS